MIAVAVARSLLGMGGRSLVPFMAGKGWVSHCSRGLRDLNDAQKSNPCARRLAAR